MARMRASDPNGEVFGFQQNKLHKAAQSFIHVRI